MCQRTVETACTVSYTHLENVKGLFSKKHNGKVGAMYQAICDEFEGDLNDGSPTYRLASREKNDVLLKATDYGVPQARERLFLVGINNAYPDLKFEYPKPSNGANCDYDYVTVSDALGDLPSIATGRESKKYCCSLKGMKEMCIRDSLKYSPGHKAKLRIRKVSTPQAPNW